MHEELKPMKQDIGELKTDVKDLKTDVKELKETADIHTKSLIKLSFSNDQIFNYIIKDKKFVTKTLGT